MPQVRIPCKVIMTDGPNLSISMTEISVRTIDRGDFTFSVYKDALTRRASIFSLPGKQMYVKAEHLGGNAVTIPRAKFKTMFEYDFTK